MDQCNNCEAKGCKTYELQSPDDVCRKRLRPKAFKQPLLKLALSEHPQGAYEFMRQYNLRLIQRGDRFLIRTKKWR